MTEPPILLPYLYDSSAKGNKLNVWAFINSNEKRSVHQVDDFSEVETADAELPPAGQAHLGVIAEEGESTFVPADDLD